jgi:hypothetical protein
MSQTNRNSGKLWTEQDIKQLKKLIKENTPTRVIGIELGRTPDAIYTKVSDLDLSLKPTNQAPYNRLKK